MSATDQSDRAIAFEAARSLGLEEEIGSIRNGMRADFAVLEADPYEVPPARIRDIGVMGTVVDGRFYP